MLATCKSEKGLPLTPPKAAQGTLDMFAATESEPDEVFEVAEADTGFKFLGKKFTTYQ